MHRGMLAGASQTKAADSRSVSEPAAHAGDASFSSLSLDELLAGLLAADRDAAAAFARRTRYLAELNHRSDEMGATHVVHDARSRRRGPHEAAAKQAAGEASVREQLGARLVVAELAVARRVSEATVRAELDEASRLARLPSAVAALEDGLLSPSHARALADGVSEVPDDLVSAYESAALLEALRGTPAQTRRRCRALQERLHPQSIDIRAARRRRERRFVFEPDRDGMAWLHLHIPCVDARGAFERVDTAARSLLSHPAEDRGIGQIRADIAADLLLHGDVARQANDAGRERDGLDAVARDDAGHTTIGPEAGRAHRAARRHDASPSVHESDRGGRYGRFRPTVRVTVPVLSLLGESDEPATLDGYGPIPLGVAEQLTASAPTVTRILTHPETGTVLSVGRSSYAVPADLRRFVQLRDARCRFPGCERGAARCDIDHTRAWEHGGTTSHDNLACLCRAHHRLKHLTTWRVTRPPDGGNALVWTSPLQRTAVDDPGPPF
jgi:hypothetical protein